MKNLSLLCVLALSLVLGACGPQRPVRDKPAPATPPAATSPVSSDWSAEQARYVGEPDEIVSVLKNGATLIARRVDSPVVSVRGYVRSGSIYEGQWLGGGLSHLLEHLVAGGSNARRSEAQNRDLLQRIGNNSNAFTSYDQTAYFINTTPENLDAAADLVSGWMLTASITPDEFKRERAVVQRELEKDKGEPDNVFFELAGTNRYRVSPVGVPVIGYQAVIQNLTRDDVYSYYRQAYQPNNMIFVVSGNLDPEKMLDSLRRYVGQSPPGRQFSHDIAAEPPVLGPRTLVATFPQLGQARLQLAFPGITLFDPDLYALDLLAVALGQGESSLLVEQIRDRKRLVSAIESADFTPHYAEGSFLVQMALPPDQIQAAAAAVLDLLEQVRREGIDEDRLKRAKTQVRASRAFSTQTSEQVASSLADDWLSSGDLHFSDRYIERIDRVTSDEVRAVARKYLDRQRLLTTAMLPEASAEAAALPKAVDVLRPVAPTTRPTALAEASAARRIVLDNGTILLLKAMPASQVVSIRLYARGGLTAENAATNGLGNLAMQMLERGTATRSAQQVAEFFDSIGGSFDASCGNNTWSWSASCLKRDLPRTLEVFADIVAKPAFDQGELAPMQQRIIAAIESQDADWFSQAMRFFRSSFFAPLHSPYQFMPIGTRGNVERFTTNELKDFYSHKILPAPRVLAIYGGIDASEAEALARRLLGGGALPTTQPAPRIAEMSGPESPAGAQPSITIERVETRKSDNPEAGVMIGFFSDSVVGDPAAYPLTVGDTMASGYGYPTGYLFETLRGRGLVYDVQAFDMPGADPRTPGAFIAYAGCEPANVNQVVDLMLLNIARLQGGPADVQPDWFSRSKRLIVTSDAMENETPQAQAQTAALDELLGLGYKHHELFADKIKAVELRDVQRVARQRLGRCVVTVVTPAPQQVSVSTGVRRYDAFPPVELAPQGVAHDAPGARP